MTVTTADCLCMQMQEGEDSYPLYKKERDGLLSSLKRRAEMIEGVCSSTAELICCTMVYLHVLNQTATPCLSLFNANSVSATWPQNRR